MTTSALARLACALALAAALAGQPARAQDVAPDASAFQPGPWAELGTLDDGATLSISEARYRDGAVLTFALRTEYAEGDTASAIEVFELDCAAARARRISAAVARRNGEMTGSNQPGAFETYPQGSVMAQLAEPLCGPSTGSG